ncbi:hypothetical protein EMA8858_04075 [Emticicia aquatica]|uniref:YXWGXW repeat-containing protein n=1 Tax=Emticicia aquatica TaxID=1681835 RepID=A0ABN8F3I1_9BACT|nr:DUF995 domain-containing protein [Emticicia aquatica]CAH0997940.1 hypothetical protein EMA8858_04075 [Emticicia aquatica]
MKNTFFLISMIGIVLMFNACTPYVSTRPPDVVTTRPMSPSNSHVWVEGNWVYNRGTHSYTRNNGYWSKPNRGRSYKEGQWRTTRRGNHWVQGRWR